MHHDELLKLPVPEVFVFDLDLTLHDVIEHYDYAMLKTFRHFGLREVALKELQGVVEQCSTTKEILSAFLPDTQVEEAFKYCVEHFFKREISIKSVLPGAREMLYTIKKHFNLPVIGVSNSEEETSKKILRDLGMFKWFDHVVGIKDGNLPKPNTQMLIKGLQLINEQPGPHVWFVGDRGSDTKCARDANCTAVRYYHKKQPHDANADIFIDCHFKFSAILKDKIKKNEKKSKKCKIAVDTIHI